MTLAINIMILSTIFLVYTTTTLFVNSFHHHAFVSYPTRRASNQYNSFGLTKHKILHQHITTQLSSTTVPNSNPSSSTHQKQYNVLYQKVLRAPATSTSSTGSSSKSTSQTFLLDLLTYLQDIYKLPNGELIMPYEIIIPDDHINEETGEVVDDGSNSGGDEGRAVVIIDSPLSNSIYDARLEIEVIGIYPDNNDIDTNDNSNTQQQLVGPSMAMVAVKKLKDPNYDSNNNDSGAAEGLYTASQNTIINSLDVGLQHFEEGRIVIPSSYDEEDVVSAQFNNDDDGVDAALKRIGYKNSINAASESKESNEMMKVEKEPIAIEKDALGNVIIDSTQAAVDVPRKEKEKKVTNKIEKSTQPKVVTSPTPSASSSKSDIQSKATTKEKKPSSNENEDYAIIMARKQAESLMTTVKAGQTTSSTHGTVSISGGESDFAIHAAKKIAEAAAKRRQANEKDKATVKAKLEHKYAVKGQESSTNNKMPPSSTKVVQQQKKKAKVQDLSNDEMFVKLSKIANKAKKSSWEKTIPKRKAVKKVSDKDIKASTLKSNEDTTPAKTDTEIEKDILQIAKENERVQQELRAATDMMPVEKDDEEGLSPEELLAQVLKFGDEKEKEDKPGHGFVEGAYGKAKELLQTDTVSTSANELEYKERDTSSDEMKRRAEEEELRRIFAAGQSVAEDRMIHQPSQVSNLSKPTITEEDINELINADETVPLNARVLDDELAELEVRMSKSQEEGVDGPNKLFDVFSGPETYNPNVDPTSSVNWPGAKEGTRTDVKLAAELSTALKQAKFAAAVLSQMREEEVDDDTNEVRYFVGEKELPLERVTLLRTCVNEAVKAGLIEDPEVLAIERSRLQMLIDELMSQPEERLEEISMSYKDLLLSDNLVDLIKERLYNMAQSDVKAQREGTERQLKNRHANERAILINLAQIAQALVKEAQALGAELEVSMLEIIRSICEVAMDPSHKTEEDTTVALTDAVRDMRPLLDDAFVAYLKYAIAEEEGKLAREGVLDDPEHNRWLFVLKIVQEGVYTELSQGVKRYIDHIWYVLRMKSKSERKELLTKLIDVMPTMDVRPFVKVVNNIVGSLGTTVKGDFADGVILGEMTNELLQLQRDVSELLPPERVDELSKDADDWAAKQRQRLLERRNLTRQRLEAARITADVDPDDIIKKPGAEAERFD